MDANDIMSVKLENGNTYVLKKCRSYFNTWINIDGTVCLSNGKYRKPILQKYCNKKSSKTGLYKYAILLEYGGTKFAYASNLVLDAWVIPKPKDKKMAIHLDGNTLNDYYKNLLWANYTDMHELRLENNPNFSLQGAFKYRINLLNPNFEKYLSNTNSTLADLEAAVKAFNQQFDLFKQKQNKQHEKF